MCREAEMGPILCSRELHESSSSIEFLYQFRNAEMGVVPAG
jgi:hypothetical protein